MTTSTVILTHNIRTYWFASQTNIVSMSASKASAVWSDLICWQHDHWWTWLQHIRRRESSHWSQSANNSSPAFVMAGAPSPIPNYGWHPLSCTKVESVHFVPCPGLFIMRQNWETSMKFSSFSCYSINYHRIHWEAIPVFVLCVFWIHSTPTYRWRQCEACFLGSEMTM